MLLLFPFVHSFSDFTSEPLDVLLRDLAFESLIRHRPRTGALYKANLPANLAGMEVSVIQLRSKTLWGRGANFSNIQIPMKTLPVPYVRRIFIVYQDFGNWSSYYYKVPGFSLVSSVVAFMAFDASNVTSNSVTKLSLNTLGKPIEIRFPNLTFPETVFRRKRCVRFAANRVVFLGETSTRNVCYSGNQGYFAIIDPMKRKERVRDWWVKGFVLGFVGLAAVCVIGMVLFKVVTAKRIHEMEREADESVGLETVWIGNSKMPSAAVTRTHPILENASLT